MQKRIANRRAERGFALAVEKRAHHRHRKSVVAILVRVLLRQLRVEPLRLAKVSKLRNDGNVNHDVVGFDIPVDQRLVQLVVKIAQTQGHAQRKAVHGSVTREAVRGARGQVSHQLFVLFPFQVLEVSQQFIGQRLRARGGPFAIHRQP